MKKITVVLMAIFLAAGVAFAKDFTLSKKAGDYAVEIRMDKNPPVVGNNNILIAIKDKSGKTVNDARVSIDYGMPAMPGMPAMNYKSDAALKGEKYKATMNLSMTGPWTVTVKITRADKTQSTKFTVDAK
jgi:hypothetical protein